MVAVVVESDVAEAVVAVVVEPDVAEAAVAVVVEPDMAEVVVTVATTKQSAWRRRWSPWPQLGDQRGSGHN